ncbi:ABC transporter inner membrane protein [Corynebacterium humireducens NBRC 106098 = DSM 45392]|uniref:ABC transporter inner membrane protein n=1 Tax=Corynebacterium humireducens NBRC 106098 = DSM 45392 TaxID=1223515 RepID=A0A0B5D7D0_9CORY|nr:ABC transporter permease [Corynebacterium humireducens]AJE32223.1 ABC transporter inner membrane protein [Corynebacterium humireducens NBRC 106098 = DSM 45392]
MSIWESVGLALGSLRTNKMRSMLTLLGVIIGIAAVIAIMTLGKAMQTQTMKSLEQFGVNDITLQVQSRDEDQESAGPVFSAVTVEPSAQITPDMVDELSRRFADRVSGVSLEAGSHTGKLTRGLATGQARVSYVNADAVSMNNHTLSAGRLLSADDVAGDRAVAVISPEIVQRFFNGSPQQAIGQDLDVEIDGQYLSLQVVGAYAPAGQQSVLVGSMEEALVYAPYPLESRISTKATGNVDSVRLRVAPDVEVESLKRDIQAWADVRYDDNPDYRAKVLDMKKEVEQLNQTMNMMSVAISAIGGISLLVGGIGVMNIMLITVTERTREIGVRKALGATRRHIRTQFVVEAMIVCLIGGVIGVVLGGGLGMVGAKLLGQFVLPPVAVVIVSLLFALGIGLFFGYYPANKAAKLDPIEALRYE